MREKIKEEKNMRPIHANIFSLTTSSGQDEVVLNAYQEYPDPETVVDKEKEIPVIREHIASLVMTREGMKTLYEILGRLIGDSK